MNSTSESLLRRLRFGTDAGAWSQFTDLYTPLLYYWLRKKHLTEADAADVVQEVFCLLLKKLPEFEYDKAGTFRGWLRTVALNKLNEMRRRKQLPTDGCLSESDPVAAPEDNHFWDVEYRLQLVERASEMIRDEFSPQTWNLYREYVKAGREPDDVANQFGVKVAEVYRAKSRIVSRLRRLLDGALD